jgi:hypothetical protein
MMVGLERDHETSALDASERRKNPLQKYSALRRRKYTAPSFTLSAFRYPLCELNLAHTYGAARGRISAAAALAHWAEFYGTFEDEWFLDAQRNAKFMTNVAKSLRALDGRAASP